MSDVRGPMRSMRTMMTTIEAAQTVVGMSLVGGEVAMTAPWDAQHASAARSVAHRGEDRR